MSYHPQKYGPCMCGGTDCPSCGPAQGYTVVRVWKNGRYTYVNPEDDEDGTEAQDAADAASEEAADAAADKWERSRERNQP